MQRMEGKHNQLHLLHGCLLICMLISAVFSNDPTTDSTTGIAQAATTAEMTTNPTTGITATGVSNTAGSTASPPTASNGVVKLTCQSFSCMGNNCYKENNLYVNTSVSECSNRTNCEMYRHNGSYFEARCGVHCMHRMCPSNGTVMNGCSIYCCNTSKCLTMENIKNYENMSKENTTSWMSTLPVTTTTTTTKATTTTIAYSDKKCRSFKCDGADCYKASATLAPKQCEVGRHHCELQKVVSGTSVSFEGGCSNTCATSTKSCASITNANCFLECCNATTTGCCMKLDGQVHFNMGARLNLNSILKIFSCAFIVLFSSQFFTSMHA